LNKRVVITALVSAPLTYRRLKIQVLAKKIWSMIDDEWERRRKKRKKRGEREKDRENNVSLMKFLGKLETLPC
jgi:hypothetical protein